MTINNPATFNNPATLADVSAALQSLGYQAPQETLVVISRACRDVFLTNLANAVSNPDPSGVAMKFIASLLRSLSAEVTAKLENLVPGTPPEDVVRVATTTPARFLSAIDVAQDKTNPRHAEALEFLVTALKNAPTRQAQAQPPAPAGHPATPPPPLSSGTRPPPPPATPGPRNQSATPPVLPPSESSRQASTVSVPPDQPSERTFDTHHVYGANAALCFNAGQYQGKHGVMVDAAAQTGTRIYDWKNALHLWLDINEIGAVIAVFRRWCKRVELNAHGKQNDKSFSIEFQKTHFFANVTLRKSGGGVVRGVKILPRDASAVCVLMLKQLAAEYPTIPLTELLATVRATHHIEDAAAA